MALLDWTCSVRAVKDTTGADHSIPGVNSTCHVPYCPLIAVSPFLLVLSVTYFKRSLWHCGQLWPYIGMGLLGTHLHQDHNAMSDSARISPRVPSTCAQHAILLLLIIHLIPRRQMFGAIDNPSLTPSVSCLTTCSYLWNSVPAANSVSHAENLQQNGYQCVCHFYKFRDGIQVTRVFRHCGDHQG